MTSGMHPLEECSENSKIETNEQKLLKSRPHPNKHFSNQHLQILHLVLLLSFDKLATPQYKTRNKAPQLYTMMGLKKHNIVLVHHSQFYHYSHHHDWP